MAPVKRPQTAASPAPARAQASLRVLATTDLHMQLTGYDYVADQQGRRHGLAGLGTLIGQARREAKARGQACVLLDNGDMLQGTPMALHLARQPVTPAHPAVACLNQLGYDAVGLGNHDLDFGLPYLRAVAQQLQMPMIASNLTGADLSPLVRSAVLRCPVPGPEGPALRIGVLSVLPQQTSVWNRQWLEDARHITAALACLPTAVAEIRAQGADLVVVLAHMGIAPEATQAEETALSLAQLPGIDALIAGHTHRRFPGRDHARAAGIAPGKGMLMAVPTVMPGHGGSDLGVLDLSLTRTPEGAWQVSAHKSTLRRNLGRTLPAAEVIRATTPAHDALRRHLGVRIGRSAQRLNNYFSLAAPTGIGALCARAVTHAVQAASRDRPLDAPLLVAASAHTTGGREGPGHYLDLPKGWVERRHLAGLNPYNNQIWVARISGAALRRRLEQAAMVFAPQHRDDAPRALLRSDVPAFNFETLYGVTYLIDLLAPAGARIRDLRFDGQPIAPRDRFVLATDQFRAAGGAGFEPLAGADVLLRLQAPGEQAFAAALSASAPTPPPWGFAPQGGLRVDLTTSPRARACLAQIAALSPEPLGRDARGFLRLRLTL